ncbi:MAG: hypothetical protein ACOH17_15165 [Cellulomonas sp.]
MHSCAQTAESSPAVVRRRRFSTMADLAFITLTVAFFAAVATIARTLDRT